MPDLHISEDPEGEDEVLVDEYYRFPLSEIEALERELSKRQKVIVEL